jgi:predicted ATP-dependent serine protease
VPLSESSIGICSRFATWTSLTKSSTPYGRHISDILNDPKCFSSLKGALGEEKHFQAYRAAEILATESKPIPWVWDSFLPRGSLSVLAAFMKVGKSTFIYALSLAVARGTSFLDYPTQKGGVLILALEEHPRDVRRRLEHFGLRPEDDLYIALGRLRSSPELLGEVRAFITQVGIALVVIDTLTQFWSVSDENSNSEVIREVTGLLDLAREMDAAVVLVHHERKSGGDEGRGIRGGSALFGLVDQALLLDRRHGGDPSHRVLRTFGRYSESPRQLILALDNTDYLNLGSNRDIDSIPERVFQAMSDSPRSISSLADELDLTHKQIRRALELLGVRVVRDGLGVKASPYVYRQSQDCFLPRSAP